VVAHRSVLREAERHRTADGHRTSPVRTLLDVARHAPLAAALIVADSACHADPALLGRLTAEVAVRRGLPGLQSARAVVALIEPRTESPLETALRILLVLAGLPRPEAQVEIAVTGLRFRADLAYRQRQVLLEADGRDRHEAWHRAQADRRRQNLLVNAGWRVLRFTWDDVLTRPATVIATVARALGLPASGVRLDLG
jgi:very-short-patch-repair endonuclease